MSAEHPLWDRSVTETPDAVFEELLEDWVGMAIQIEQEWGCGEPWDIHGDEEQWRARFGNAIGERNRR